MTAGASRRPRAPLAAAALVAALPVAALVAGWNPVEWGRRLWQSLSSMTPAYIVPALALQTLQLLLSAAAMYGILRYAYPRGDVRRMTVLAAVATGAAVNAFVPANLGTAVMILLLVATIESATPAGVVAATAVEKVFWLVAGVLVNVYGTLSVGASFRDKLRPVLDHPWLTVIVVTAVAAAVVFGGRLVWQRLSRLWGEAKQGGSVLGEPRVYVRSVLLPQFLAWCCKGGVVAVLLSAFAIPVGIGSVVSVLAGNTLANVASVTPGGVGVNQALSVASLHGAADAATAEAYSLAQQLLTTAWSVVLAVVLVGVAFGRSRGREVVEQAVRAARADADATRAQRPPARSARP